MATPTEAAMGEAARAKDPFNYDYETLRLVGLVLAIAMFVLGVLIALSKKFKCKKAEPSPHGHSVAPPPSTRATPPPQPGSPLVHAAPPS
ncbi:FXYD domain-containing ion transport regulator 7 isoform X1 [Falco rusticolus]|uniref:FXYD domain-containing ion transport regulator 7 isoform X1 n=1 Tax=Falco rusticolus TaxID=120794 RepID=UPI00188677AF|nr:FXYD domain-containing ion transport regulator 7 isoform X1 [Falco rusticolus]